MLLALAYDASATLAALLPACGCGYLTYRSVRIPRRADRD